jgi:hypothetical protein
MRLAILSAAAAQESVRLQLELRRGESLDARPSLSLSPGSEGRLEVEGLGSIGLTPTLPSPDRLSIAFDIRVGEREIKPRLVLSKTSMGSISIQPDSGGEPFNISVTWQR